MRKILFVVAACAAALVAGAKESEASPAGGAGALGNAVDSSMTEPAQVYVRAGRRYCFYVDAWRGPGWYRCGFAWRRGLGWGGTYG